MDSDGTELEGKAGVVEAIERQAIPLLFLVNLHQNRTCAQPRENA